MWAGCDQIIQKRLLFTLACIRLISKNWCVLLPLIRQKVQEYRCPFFPGHLYLCQPVEPRNRAFLIPPHLAFTVSFLAHSTFYVEEKVSFSLFHPFHSRGGPLLENRLLLHRHPSACVEMVRDPLSYSMKK